MIGKYTRVKYPLVFPFKLSYGTFHERSGVIVELSEGTHTGYGELSFVPYYGKNEADVLSALNQIMPWMENLSKSWTPAELYRQISRIFSPDPFLMSALDCALYDLYGKKQGIPVWEIVDSTNNVTVPSSLTVTEDDWEKKLDWGWPVLKLKMGFDGDMILLQEIRKQYDGELRIDANSGWTIEGLKERADQLRKWNVSLVEQPVLPNTEDLLRGLDLGLTLAADESVQRLDDLDRIAGMYQVVNIKLQKCGGITPALEMIRKCHELDLKIMAGCMTESSVGIGAMAQLGSYFDYLDLDGEHLIKNSLSEQKFVVHGQVKLTSKAGLGVKIALADGS